MEEVWLVHAPDVPMATYSGFIYVWVLQGLYLEWTGGRERPKGDSVLYVPLTTTVVV